MNGTLTEAGREAVALALLFLKDWKADGKFDLKAVQEMFGLADILGVRAELEKLQPQIPVMKVTPRYPE